LPRYYASGKHSRSTAECGRRQVMLSKWVKLKLIWLSEGPLMAQNWKMPRGTRGVIALKENPETVNSGKFKI